MSGQRGRDEEGDRHGRHPEHGMPAVEFDDGAADSPPHAQQDVAQAGHRQDEQYQREGVQSPSAISIRPNAAATSCAWASTERTNVLTRCGTVQDDQRQLAAEHGDHEQDPRGEGHPGPSLRPPTRGSADRPGIMLRSVGAIRLNRSGTPIRSAKMKYPSSLSEGISCWIISICTRKRAATSGAYPVPGKRPPARARRPR